MADPFLKTVLDHVVARDVVRKLVQVREIISSSSLFNSTMICYASMQVYAHSPSKI